MKRRKIMQFMKPILFCLVLSTGLFSNYLFAKEVKPNIFIEGATEEILEGNVWIFCGKSSALIDGKKFQELEVSMLKKLYQFKVVMPLKTALGKHTIIGSHDYPPNRAPLVKVRYRDGKAKGYKNGTGEIDIKKIPQAQGEFFIADINAKLKNKKGEELSLKVKINAKAGIQSFDECPK